MTGCVLCRHSADIFLTRVNAGVMYPTAVGTLSHGVSSLDKRLRRQPSSNGSHSYLGRLEPSLSHYSRT